MTDLDRVTALFEKWAAEEDEHRQAGEYGLAEGLRVAIEDLRAAVHGGRAETTTATTEGMAGIDRARVRRVLENEFRSFLAHDPYDPDRFWGLAVDAVMGLLVTARALPTRQQLIHVLRENDPDNYGGHNTAAWYYEAQADAVLALLAEPQGWTEEAGVA